VSYHRSEDELGQRERETERERERKSEGFNCFEEIDTRNKLNVNE
jgi:hypothetical protein